MADRILIILIVLIALGAGVYGLSLLRFGNLAPPATSAPGDTPPESDVVLDELPLHALPNPVRITGKAKGIWFFEASFPIEIQDDSGNRLGIGIAQAQEDWMTSDYVPFRADIAYATPATPNGVIILRKDNPSGLPEQDKAIRIPVNFRNE